MTQTRHPKSVADAWTDARVDVVDPLLDLRFAKASQIKFEPGGSCLVIEAPG